MEATLAQYGYHAPAGLMREPEEPLSLAGKALAAHDPQPADELTPPLWMKRHTCVRPSPEAASLRAASAALQRGSASGGEEQDEEDLLAVADTWVKSLRAAAQGAARGGKAVLLGTPANGLGKSGGEGGRARTGGSSRVSSRRATPAGRLGLVSDVPVLHGGRSARAGR